MTDRAFVTLAALFGLNAVAAGALAAHGIADATAARLVETASRYQMWHALAICALTALPIRRRAAQTAFVLGVLLFSGSLYALAAGAPRAITWITPVGGLALIAGWALAAGATWLRWGDSAAGGHEGAQLCRRQ